MTHLFWQSVSKKSWSSTPYPWRPGIRDAGIFIFYILKSSNFKKKPSVLLVGATKELRILLSFLAIPYDLVDYSENMLDVTKPEKNDLMRNFYQQDWFQPLPPHKKYDLILGDLILNLLDEEKVRNFFSIYANYLYKNGSFLIRTRCVTEKTIDSIYQTISKQLQSIKKNSMYEIFANFQTLQKINKTKADEILLQYNNSETNLYKKELALQLQNDYLNSNLNYFVHTKIFLHNISKKIYILFSCQPKNYLDSFAFIFYKPN